MGISAAIYSILQAHAGTLALVSTRVYPVIAPQKAALPRITYQIISSPGLHAMGSDPGLKSPRIQVDCWADTYAGADALAVQVLDALQDYSGTIASVTIQRSFLENETDFADPDTKIKDIVYRKSFDFIVWYS